LLELEADVELELESKPESKEVIEVSLSEVIEASLELDAA
jgi:hypothetical protein